MGKKDWLMRDLERYKVHAVDLESGFLSCYNYFIYLFIYLLPQSKPGNLIFIELKVHLVYSYEVQRLGTCLTLPQVTLGQQKDESIGHHGKGRQSEERVSPPVTRLLEASPPEQPQMKGQASNIQSFWK